MKAKTILIATIGALALTGCSITITRTDKADKATKTSKKAKKNAHVNYDISMIEKVQKMIRIFSSMKFRIQLEDTH